MSTIEAVRPQGLNARAASLLNRITYRRAIESADREAIFRLRYEAYLREGAITARADERFTDAVDEQENAFIYGVYVDDVLAGSIRLNVTLPYASALPTTAVFPELVEPMINAGCVIVDPTRFVANHNFSRRFPELPYLTLRLAWLAMEHFEGEYILLAIRPEHRAFYRRYWDATELCEARPYPKLTKPVGLSVVNYLDVKTTVEARYPFLASTEAERAGLFAAYHVSEEADDTLTDIWQINPARAERNFSV
ncbi:N-acyl amino acid synthase FeeM domain-containing protein [Methylobacterium phyllosphaerae]